MLKAPLNIPNQDKNKWFEELIAAIQTHQFMLDTNTATDELKNFYSNAMDGNADKIALQSKNLGQQHFIQGIVVDYLSQVSRLAKAPHKLAFDLADNEVLIWAEVDDNDNDLEKNLVLAEARVNAKYHGFGYDITSMIVERSDNLSIPAQYIIYKKEN